MAVDWSKWILGDRERLLPAGVMSLLVAPVLLFLHINREKIRTEDDFHFISGPFAEYRWTSYGGKGGSNLTFRLQNYSNRFQIKADFYSILRQQEFKAIPYDEVITVGILKTSSHDLNTLVSPIPVYSVTSGSFTYLDPDAAISKHNSSFMFYAAGFFLILGCTFIYLGWKAKVKSSKREPISI